MGSFATLSGNGYLHKRYKNTRNGLEDASPGLLFNLPHLEPPSPSLPLKWLAIPLDIADSRLFNTPGARVLQKIRKVIVNHGY